MELTSTHMRYLLAIYQLNQRQTGVSSLDIADFLQVKKASVSRMTPILMEKNLLVKERYGKIYLTADGYLIAKRTHERVAPLSTLIGQALSLSPSDAWNAAFAAVCALPTEILPFSSQERLL